MGRHAGLIQHGDFRCRHVKSACFSVLSWPPLLAHRLWQRRPLMADRHDTSSAAIYERIHTATNTQRGGPITMRQVSFYMSDPSIGHIPNIDPDRDWRYFGNGVVIWIAQTFLRLRNCGAKVALTSTPPNDGVVVLHADDLPSYVAANGRRNRCFVVCVRADRNPNPDTDLEIVQNRFLEQSNRTKYIPHWPQPGLKSRVRERGTLVQNITFKGYPAQLHEMFRTLHWQRFLKLHKLRWNENSATWTGKRLRLFSEMNWNDYSESDVLIAVRPN